MKGEGEKDLRQLSAQIEDLVRKVEGIADPVMKANATVLVQSLLDLHGAAFQRLTEALLREGESGRQILAKLGADDLVGSLLLLYGLHPDSFEVRLQKAMERVRKILVPQGIKAELISVHEGIVQVRLAGRTLGCASTGNTFERLVETAIYDATPEVAAVQVETAIQSADAETLVQLELNSAAPQHA